MADQATPSGFVTKTSPCAIASVEMRTARESSGLAGMDIHESCLGKVTSRLDALIKALLGQNIFQSPPAQAEGEPATSLVPLKGPLDRAWDIDLAAHVHLCLQGLDSLEKTASQLSGQVNWMYWRLGQAYEAFCVVGHQYIVRLADSVADIITDHRPIEVMESETTGSGMSNIACWACFMNIGLHLEPQPCQWGLCRNGFCEGGNTFCLSKHLAPPSSTPFPKSASTSQIVSVMCCMQFTGL